MGQRVLLVEGKDDEQVVKHLCRAHGIDPVPFAVHQPQGEGAYGDAGVERLLDQVPIRLDTDVERLAVILDADEDAGKRWIQLRDRLRRAGHPGIPDQPRADGVVVDLDRETRLVRFGVWIMPNNAIPGMLEDFLAWLTPPDDRMMPHVGGFIDGIPKSERLFPETHAAKARIHSFSAVQKEPGKPLGLAVSFRYLDPTKEEVVRPFIRWLSPC